MARRSAIGSSALWIWVSLVILILLLPVFVIVPLSFTGEGNFHFPPREWSLDPFTRLFTERRWWASIINSVNVAVLTTVFGTLIGVSAALGLRNLPARVSSMLRSLFLLPLVVPSIVIGVAVYGVYLNAGLAGSVVGFVIAHTVLALPFVILVVSAQLSNIDRTLELAAESLGGRPVIAFFTVTLPLIAPSVLTGALFAFVTSFDESVVALFLQSPTVSTLPVTMFSAVTQRLDVTIASAATLVITSTVILLLVMMIAGGRSRKDTE